MNSIKRLIAAVAVAVAAFLVPGAQPVQAIDCRASCTYPVNVCPDCVSHGTIVAVSTTTAYQFTCCQNSIRPCVAFQKGEVTNYCDTSDTTGAQASTHSVVNVLVALTDRVATSWKGGPVVGRPSLTRSRGRSIDQCRMPTVLESSCSLSLP